MLLEQLLEFEWLNEPEDVDFQDAGMKVTARKGTDFWQNKKHNVHMDNGHFFFTRKCANFTLTTHWEFDNIEGLNQCGIMVRADEQNWVKASILTESLQYPKLGSCVTNNGYTDWAAQNISKDIKEIWFKLKRQNGDYLLFYSEDGEKFCQIRLFNLYQEDVEVKAGAYICAPKNEGYQAVLKGISIEAI